MAELGGHEAGGGVDVRPKVISKIIDLTGLTAPCPDLAVFQNGNIVVSEHKKNGQGAIRLLAVRTVNRDGETDYDVNTVRTDLNFPRGVAISVDDRHILVVDGHRLWKLTVDGTATNDPVGSMSPGAELSYPASIAVHPTTGQIFVTEWDFYDNTSIKVFSNDLEFDRTIPFNDYTQPDIAIDQTGNLYFVGEKYISKVSNDGTFIKQFNSTPNQKEIKPASVVVHNNLVYVAEYKKSTILVFDTEGTFQHTLGGRIMMHRPEKMCANLGYLYILDRMSEENDTTPNVIVILI